MQRKRSSAQATPLHTHDSDEGTVKSESSLNSHRLTTFKINVLNEQTAKSQRYVYTDTKTYGKDTTPNRVELSNDITILPVERMSFNPDKLTPKNNSMVEERTEFNVEDIKS